MKKTFMLFVILLSANLVNAQAQLQEKAAVSSIIERNSLRLDINTLSPEETSRINSVVADRRDSRGLLLTLGTTAATTMLTTTASVTIDEIIKLTQLRQNQKTEWNHMIWNECRYADSLSSINNLTDFYSEGSSLGALDPSYFRFNGFTLNAQRDGEDVLKFYCHVNIDTIGLEEIYNHSRFSLVLDSMYFYPYRCHLPNFSANQIQLETGKSYKRNIRFSYEDRDNLMLNLRFTISSSWYNEAIILNKDVELGAFNVQIPIEKDRLIDSVFIYKKGMPGVEPLNITGDCFIVPRSYMPLPNGRAHWGTGEYSVKVVVEERCNITPAFQEHWHKDYRCLKGMKKESAMKAYLIKLYQQNTNNIIHDVLKTASDAAIEATGLSKTSAKTGGSAKQ